MRDLVSLTTLCMMGEQINRAAWVAAGKLPEESRHIGEPAEAFVRVTNGIAAHCTVIAHRHRLDILIEFR